MIDMVDPYDIIQMPWITEKTLEARRVADQEGGYRENNNRIALCYCLCHSEGPWAVRRGEECGIARWACHRIELVHLGRAELPVKYGRS